MDANGGKVGVVMSVAGFCAVVAFAAPAPRLPVDKSPPAKTPASSPAPDFKPIDPSVLSAAQGWTDLFQDPKLGDWMRVGQSGEKDATSRSPWRYDPESGILAYDGSSPEMLLHKTPWGDGVLHVEWRFPGNPTKPVAAVLVRTKPDRSMWFESSMSPASVGSLTGATVGADGNPRRFTSGARKPDLVRKKADEWNVTEIACLGTRLTLRINGVTIADYNGCSVPSAHVGVEAGDSAIEFRAIKFKAVK